MNACLVYLLSTGTLGTKDDRYHQNKWGKFAPFKGHSFSLGNNWHMIPVVDLWMLSWPKEEGAVINPVAWQWKGKVIQGGSTIYASFC
jgi:hypothetical protein